MDKPPVIEKKQKPKTKKIFLYLLIAIIAIGALLYQKSILKKLYKAEKKAWDSAETLYKKVRGKYLMKLDALSRKLDDVNTEKEKNDKRLAILIREKDELEKEKKQLLEGRQKAEVQAREAVAKKEEELKKSLSKRYEDEIAGLKEKLKQTEESKKGKDVQLEEGLEELKEKNRALSDSLTKTNQTNEYLMKKIENLQKIRNELEEELRRGKEGTTSTW